MMVPNESSTRIWSTCGSDVRFVRARVQIERPATPTVNEARDDNGNTAADAVR